MTEQILVAWIGKKDLGAAKGDTAIGLGPIAQAVSVYPYSVVQLLSNYEPPSLGVEFTKWLALHTRARVHLKQVKLSSPINFSEIYQAVIPVLDTLRTEDANLTYHLSPGTPAMQSVWILLAKTTYPARLIQSSVEAGVEEADIPFDISAEFIPRLLRRSDDRLTALAQGTPAENAQFSAILHRSPVMQRVIEQGRRVALRGIPVLIEGESGTGKELMARAIHNASRRAVKEFVPVNCGAIPPELVESEFFGHKKGAFTGAVADRKGHFERADGGTLFLDEIGELPKAVQVKLLRTLQEGVVTPVGSSAELKVDVRIIAATNRILINEVVVGNFREDLFYRLAVAIIKLPPLRERAGDISLLIDKLLTQVNQANAQPGQVDKKLAPAAKNFMLNHKWPGNIRELINTLHRAAVWSDENTIDLELIRDAILVPPRLHDDDDILHHPIEQGVPLEDLLGQVARHYIKAALDCTHSNKTSAAKLLGLGSYQTLTNWMNRYGMKD